MKYPTATFVAAVMSILAPMAHADLGSDLDEFIDELGGAASGAGPSSFEGQGYHYLNGGQLFVRVPQREAQIFGYRAPNYRAGCGGIDMFGGGFAFLDADELVNVLKDVGSNAASYAFMLALRTISSQISNTLGENFDWMLKNQGMTFNTCERAQWAVNSAMSGQLLGNQMSVCISQRTVSLGESYDEARQKCGAGGEQESSINTDDARAQAFIEGNLVWMLMEQGGFFVDDPELREMVMSVTGTVIKSKRDAAGELAGGDEDAAADVRHLPSVMAASDDLLEGILRGADAIRVYECDTVAGTYACLNPTEKTIELFAADSVMATVSVWMEGLYDAIRNKGIVEVQEEELIQKTTMPLHRMLAIAAGMRGEAGADLVSKYTEAVSVDILFTYLERIIYLIKSHAGAGQWGDSGVELATQNEAILNEVRIRKARIHRETNAAMQVAEEMQYYERLIISGMPKRLVEVYLWNADGTN